MPDIRIMFEGKYLASNNLLDDQGRERELTLTIARIEKGKVTGDGGRETGKPIVHFQEAVPALVLNKTMLKTLYQLYGTYEAHDLVGKKITVYPTTTQFGADTKPCVRIRPRIPGKETANATK